MAADVLLRVMAADAQPRVTAVVDVRRRAAMAADRRTAADRHTVVAAADMDMGGNTALGSFPAE
jgi:hypothetical protein